MQNTTAVFFFSGMDTQIVSIILLSHTIFVNIVVPLLHVVFSVTIKLCWLWRTIYMVPQHRYYERLSQFSWENSVGH